MKLKMFLGVRESFAVENNTLKTCQLGTHLPVKKNFIFVLNSTE